MKLILIPVILSVLSSCKQSTSQTVTQVNQPMDTYQQFDSSIHLQPAIDKTRFDTTQGWDFGWMLLEPINIATDQENSEIELSKRLSKGQKALYFIWYLDAEVTNGGFIQFYWNGY